MAEEEPAPEPPPPDLFAHVKIGPRKGQPTAPPQDLLAPYEGGEAPQLTVGAARAMVREAQAELAEDAPMLLFASADGGKVLLDDDALLSEACGELDLRPKAPEPEEGAPPPPPTPPPTSWVVAVSLAAGCESRAEPKP